LNEHVPLHVPRRVLSAVKARKRFRIENLARARIQNSDRLRACSRIPINQIKRDPV
jgi:5-enolpyruvylshikimate-3-phosphate synthase